MHASLLDAARPLLAGLLVAALLAGCGSEAAPARQPNVLLIVLDTLRTDHMSGYGYALPTTPNLDALATQGVQFMDCTAQAAWTGPSMISLMTGLPIFNSLMNLPADFPVLAESFQRAGYRTGAVVANSVLGEEHGFNRGFDQFSARQVGTEAWTAVKVNRHAVEFLERDDDRPFLLWLHYLDTHNPYTPPALPWTRTPEQVFTPWERAAIEATILKAPEGERARLYGQIGELAREVDRYDAELHWLDARLGELLAELGRLGVREETLIVVAADHGETLFRRPEHPDHFAKIKEWKDKHGMPMELADYMMREHHSTNFQELLRTPLIVAGPGIAGGRRIDVMVSNLNLRPTLLGLAGLPVPEGPGRDLSAALRSGGKVTPDAWVTSAAHQAVSARLPDGRKFVLPAEGIMRRLGVKPAVYSLRDDPDELRPLPLDERAQAILDELAEQWQNDAFTAWVGTDSKPEDIEILKELGYVR
ncbi:MAG TPA: sulfatase [Planctomycetota bacterium]|nr:sulfatase [Planctomycetota bacterium]